MVCLLLFHGKGSYSWIPRVKGGPSGAAFFWEVRLDTTKHGGREHDCPLSEGGQPWRQEEAEVQEDVPEEGPAVGGIMKHIFQILHVEVWERDEVFGYYTSYEKAVDVLKRIESEIILAQAGCDYSDYVDGALIRTDGHGHYIMAKIPLDVPCDVEDLDD